VTVGEPCEEAWSNFPSFVRGKVPLQRYLTRNTETGHRRLAALRVYFQRENDSGFRILKNRLIEWGRGTQRVHLQDGVGPGQEGVTPGD